MLANNFYSLIELLTRVLDRRLRFGTNHSSDPKSVSLQCYNHLPCMWSWHPNPWQNRRHIWSLVPFAQSPDRKHTYANNSSPAVVSKPGSSPIPQINPTSTSTALSTTANCALIITSTLTFYLIKNTSQARGLTMVYLLIDLWCNLVMCPPEL